MVKIPVADQCFIATSDVSMHEVSGSAAALSPQESGSEIAEDFKTEHHPHSSHPMTFQSAEDFGQSAEGPAVQPDEQPWRPFRTAADLEFADIAVQAGLNASHVNALLGLISWVAGKSANIMFKNENDLCLACDRAAQELTPVSHIVLQIVVLLLLPLLKHIICTLN